MRVLLIEPGKTARPAEIGGNLHDLQKAVGGIIQILFPWEDPVALVCNDEGKLLGLPLNRALEDYDIIAGTFFICGVQGEDLVSLTEQQMQKYRNQFYYPEKFIRTPEGILCIEIRSEEGMEKAEKAPPKKPKGQER